MFYKGAKDHFESILQSEAIDIPREMLDELLKIMSKFTTYEEEEVKIKPYVYISENIESILSFAPHKIFNRIVSIEHDIVEFGKKLKSLIPLCNKGWIIVIEFASEKITLSIMRYIAKHKSQDQERILLSEENQIEGFKLLSIECINSHQIVMKGINSGISHIDFYLHDTGIIDKSDKIKSLVSDFTSSIEKKTLPQTGYVDISRILENFFTIAMNNIHGCIILVADEQHGGIESISTDYIRLTAPISVLEYATAALNTLEDTNAVEEYYAINGLFMNLLDVDGITVLNTKGEIIGYNMFYSGKSCNKPIVGGARKRAAYNLAYCGNQCVMSVYFQSQDGGAEYLKGEHHE